MSNAPKPESLPPYRPPVEIFDEIILERRAMLFEGMDAACDDRRGPGDWLISLGAVVGAARIEWRPAWIKVAALAIAVVEAHDRAARAAQKRGVRR